MPPVNRENPIRVNYSAIYRRHADGDKRFDPSGGNPPLAPVTRHNDDRGEH